MKPIDLMKSFGVLILGVSLGLCSVGCGSRGNAVVDPNTGTDPTTPAGQNPDDPNKTTGSGIRIQDIQDPTSAQHPAEKGEVFVEGVIVTTVVDKASTKSTQPDSFFVSEPEGGKYAGIYVYAKGLTVDLVPGDVVDISGNYTEYYDNSQIVATSITKTGQAALPPAVVVPLAEVRTGNYHAEEYEGCLVKLENVTVSNADLGHGNYAVKQAGSDEEMVIGTRYSSLLQYRSKAGDAFTSMSGVLEYSFNEFRVQPTRCEDLVSPTRTCSATPPTPPVTNCPAEGAAVQIAQLQDASRPDAVGPGCKVKLSNIVVTSPVFQTGSAGKEKPAFFAQEASGGPWSGIFVYVFSGSVPAELAVGSSLTLEGATKDYYGKLEFMPTSITVNGPGTVPAPVLVKPSDVRTASASAKSYEGVLVKMEKDVVVVNAKVTNDKGTDLGQFTVALKDDLANELTVGNQLAYAYDRKQGDVFTTLIGIMDYSYNQFRLEPRGSEDLVFQAGDPTDPTTPTIPTVKIADLQSGAVAATVAVKLENVVVTTPVFTSGKKPAFFVQDPSGGLGSGIFVWLPSISAPEGLQPGQFLTLEGATKDYYGKLEFIATAITVGEMGTVPAPIQVTPAQVRTGSETAKSYEGMLVQLVSVKVQNPKVVDPKSKKDLGQFTVVSADDAAAELIVGNQIIKPEYASHRTQGDEFTSLIGVMDYSYSEYRLEPRSNGDLTLAAQNPPR